MSAYPAGTEFVCDCCRRVLGRLIVDRERGDVMQVADFAPDHATGVGSGHAIACPEHGILWRNEIIVRRPDGTEERDA